MSSRFGRGLIKVVRRAATRCQCLDRSSGLRLRRWACTSRYIYIATPPHPTAPQSRDQSPTARAIAENYPPLVPPQPSERMSANQRANQPPHQTHARRCNVPVSPLVRAHPGNANRAIRHIWSASDFPAPIRSASPTRQTWPGDSFPTKIRAHRHAPLAE